MNKDTPTEFTFGEPEKPFEPHRDRGVLRCSDCKRHMTDAHREFGTWIDRDRRIECYGCKGTNLVVAPGTWLEPDYKTHIAKTALSHRPGWNASRISRVFPRGPSAFAINPRNPKSPIKLYLLADVEREESVSAAYRALRDNAPKSVEWFVAHDLEFIAAIGTLTAEQRAIVKDAIARGREQFLHLAARKAKVAPPSSAPPTTPQVEKPRAN